MGGMPTHTVASPQAVGIPGAHMTSHDVLLTPQAIVVDGVSSLSRGLGPLVFCVGMCLSH